MACKGVGGGRKGAGAWGRNSGEGGVVWSRTAAVVVGKSGDPGLNWGWEMKGKEPRTIVGREVIYSDGTERVRMRALRSRATWSRPFLVQLLSELLGIGT